MSGWTRGEVDPELDAWMAAGAGGDEACCARHETPIAKVYVFAERVLKLKKPVDFGFLDFSTLDKREWATRRELDFNRRIAPDVYRAVHAVTRGADGALSLGGRGETQEWVIEMRPFDSDAILAKHPERIDGPLAERLGREIARVQAEAPLTPEGRGAAGLEYVTGSNAEQLRSLSQELGAEAVEKLIADTQAAFVRHAGLLDRRRDAGLVRRCHGDLHLGNIVVEDGQPILFDCIEFSDVLSEIDVMYDVAFLLMDLGFRGCAEAANRVLNGWLDEGARSFDATQMEGLVALPLFLSVRAAVRAHVTGHAGELGAARKYIEAAQRYLEPPKPGLCAIGGLSGSGKSTFARALAVRRWGAPGAVVLRSDEVRKRMAGVASTDRLPKESYTEEQAQKVYDQMFAETRPALDAGWPVILDATFLKLEERVAARTLTLSAGMGFQGLWMEGPPEVLRKRVSERRGDASDADEPVLDIQLAQNLGNIDWERIDATAPKEAQLAAAEKDQT
ncbi:bifunctional aminoglycoside phosphotransferase/ATP-binding protein [Caulobacter sp. S45]|uniref:bifunctional aminoglycoside phosphotransferase/ATP-binding protein n=1 Tax=Caulobacter sp. S45 TaxID=1641861 RepID=UPI00131CAA05|nr:bifunctional aminoglycoside phosphotransferase/ATP-binding protein [Caulobacter sp. S45]